MRCAVFMLLIIAFAGCGPDKDPAIDSPAGGIINISVDESFRPVMEEQLQMYKETYPNTTINASFKTEADCLKDIIRDTSTRMAVVTRGLTETEENFFRDSLNYVPSWNMVARDGIAVLASAKSNDTAFTMQQLTDFLTGRDTSKQIIFDGLNATSTYRFVKDSLLKG
ncbi:MAG: phosphate ABC transporter substrate-binding protein, PhoT family, partial [Chitinophagaceae bacterium]